MSRSGAADADAGSVQTSSTLRAWLGDARHYQIAALGMLLVFNIAALDLGARLLPSMLAITSALATQWACSRIWRLPRIDLRSSLITGLSLSLLLRADEPVYVAAGIIALRQGRLRAVLSRHVRPRGVPGVRLGHGLVRPCAAEPLKNKELVELGARWIVSDDDQPFRGMPDAGAFVTRLHVRYDAAHFPEDLAFMETKDRENFQGRYVLQHPWQGRAGCSAGDHYWKSLPERYRREADTLAQLTGWQLAEIQTRMEASGQTFTAKPADSRSIFDWLLNPDRR